MHRLFLAMGLGLFLAFAPSVLASGREPVAHIVEVDLQGADFAKGTAIVREGTERKPAIWMPLYDGDIVFVRDPKSRVLVDYGEGGRVAVDQSRMRIEISEATAHGGDTWNIITSLGELLMGEEGEQVPTNLVSKGDDATLTVPVANRTPNFVRGDGEPVWIAWNGGSGPFTISLEVDGKDRILTETKDRLVKFDLPRSAGPRLIVTIADAKKRSIRIPLRVKHTLPTPPANLASDTRSSDLRPALTAAWLASQEDGAWRIEAVRMLRNEKDLSADGRRVGDALLAGWRPD